jgi:(5-formylfuran-3-yl)methyl phosphate synthase
MKAGTLRLLVSVRTVDEALQAAAGGADFIDLKEPRGGALGGLPPASLHAIVQALRSQGCTLPVSATIGDPPMHDKAAILQAAAVVQACGVDYVKVGIEPGPQAAAVLDDLAATGWPVVPVFIADRGLDFGLIARAQHFPAVMLDTADKASGHLFDVVAMADLRRFVAWAREAGALVGLAGALRLPQLPALAALAPDFAGFRSAVCRGGRGTALDAGLLRELAAQLHGRVAALRPA